MLKAIISCFSLLLLNISLLFGNAGSVQNDGLDDSSPVAVMKLKRAEQILGTLVPDPESYKLFLAPDTTFGGAAVPPHVYSDKPVIIIFQGALAPSRTNEEIAFMMAHELGHLQMYHNERLSERMDQIFAGPPAGYSGTLFKTFYQKLEERDADMFGLDLYKNAGYDLTFFSRTLELVKIDPNLHFGATTVFKKPLSSLSIKNSHFSIEERFELLAKEAIT